MKRKVRKFAEGGLDKAGYEEDPKPGDNRREIVARRKAKRDPSARKMSGMEFLSDYEKSAPSKRMRDEAEEATKPKRQSLPGDRSTAFKDQKGIARGAINLDKEAVERGLEGMSDVGQVAAGVLASEAQIPLRLKQLMRARRTARANEAARAADRAGESARRGMSRRDIPRYDERYRAGEGAYEQRKAYEDAALNGLMYKKGGSVSSASKRADGIAQRGKTKGRMV